MRDGETKMHIHLHTKTVVREGRFDSTVKNVFKVCRCGDEKHVRVVLLHHSDFLKFRVTEG